MNNDDILQKKLKNIHDLMSWSKVIEITGVIMSSFIFLSIFAFSNAEIKIAIIMIAFEFLTVTQSFAIILQNKAHVLDTLIQISQKES